MVEGGIRRKGRAREELKKRVETLSHFLNQVMAVVVWVIAAF